MHGRLQRVSDLQVSPDGHYALFALTQPDVGMNQNRTHLWLLDLARKGAPTRLVADETANDWNGRWLRDSRSLYFLTDRSGCSPSRTRGTSFSNRETACSGTVRRLPGSIAG